MIKLKEGQKILDEDGNIYEIERGDVLKEGLHPSLLDKVDKTNIVDGFLSSILVTTILDNGKTLDEDLGYTVKDFSKFSISYVSNLIDYMAILLDKDYTVYLSQDIFTGKLRNFQYDFGMELQAFLHGDKTAFGKSGNAFYEYSDILQDCAYKVFKKYPIRQKYTCVEIKDDGTLEILTK